jgi:hypothetical protein
MRAGTPHYTLYTLGIIGRRCGLQHEERKPDFELT